MLEVTVRLSSAAEIATRSLGAFAEFFGCRVEPAPFGLEALNGSPLTFISVPFELQNFSSPLQKLRGIPADVETLQRTPATSRCGMNGLSPLASALPEGLRVSADSLFSPFLYSDKSDKKPVATAVRAEDVLTAHGFDGDKLLAYAQTIARHHVNRTASTLGDRHEDLVMHLVEVGLRTAVKYNPERSSSTGRYTFGSYIYDVMKRRVPDFYRKKAEGFGDKRKGHNDRIVLSGDPKYVETSDLLTEDFADDLIDRLELEGV